MYMCTNSLVNNLTLLIMTTQYQNFALGLKDGNRALDLDGTFLFYTYFYSLMNLCCVMI